MRGGVLGYAAQASLKIDAAKTEKDLLRMETSWATSRILPLRSGQSRPKAGCKRKGFIYGQALNKTGQMSTNICILFVTRMLRLFA